MDIERCVYEKKSVLVFLQSELRYRFNVWLRQKDYLQNICMFSDKIVKYLEFCFVMNK